jgi:hypothetical protein
MSLRAPLEWSFVSASALGGHRDPTRARIHLDPAPDATKIGADNHQPRERMMALTTEDRIEIGELYARYNQSMDMKDPQAWAATFTADGAFDAGAAGTATGTESLVELASGMARSGRQMRHWVNNLIVSESDSGATGKAYLALFAVGEGGPQLSTTGLYEDELVKTADGWRFKARKFTVDS